MIELADLGFSKGVIVETVVSTYSVSGKPNAAPMGAKMKNLKRIALKVYNSSSTYKNLQSKRCAVINITSDPEIFYYTAFKGANPEGKVPQEWFEKAAIIDAPRLRTADARIEVAIASIEPIDAGTAEALCDVKLIRASANLPKAYCRAAFATIEAIIHATRVKPFMAHGDSQEQKQALKLLETIRQCQDVVNRVAPNSRYSKIMEDLSQRIDSWRGKNDSAR